MSRVRFLGLVLLLACGKKAAPPTPAPAAKPATPAAVPTVAKAKVDAFRKCREASERLESAAPVPGSGSRAVQLARACADIYSEPGCSAVWRNPPEKIEELAGAIAKACRDAYCPRLPAPRPALCATRQLPPPVEMSRRWRELQARIYALELGVAPEVVEALSPPTRFTISKQAAPSGPAVPPVVVRVATEGGGARVSVEGQKDTVLLVAGGKDDPFAALARRVKAQAPAGTGILLDAEPSVGYDMVVRVLDGLNEAGFVDIDFQSPHL
jgi:hypothetical protein